MSPLRSILVFLAMVLAACSPGGSSASSASPTGAASASELRPVTLLLGYRPDVQFAPFYLAQQAGYYADAGLEVTIEHKQAPDVVRLVADGEAEFGVADATDTMIARTSGIPVVAISTLYARFPVALIGPSGSVPSDPADLAGMRIGTPGRFGSSWHALLALLEAGNLTADDVTIREYPQFDQVTGLLAGDVDLITGFRNNEPLRLESQGMTPELLTVDDIAPLPGPGVFTSDTLLADEPELAHAFAEATARGQQGVIDDPQAGFDAASAEVSAITEDSETARAILDATVELWSGDEGFDGGRIDADLWATGYETLRRLGFIDGSVPVDEMVAPDVMGS
jgi:NitT/TauT family transport system substrate-binding protein